MSECRTDVSVCYQPIPSVTLQRSQGEYDTTIYLSYDCVVFALAFGGGGAEMERDMNSLLQIWDLDEMDLTYMASSSYTPSDSSVDAPLQTRQTEGVKYCDSCHALNVHDANWCIECGVSVNKSTVKRLQSAKVDKDRIKHLETGCMILPGSQGHYEAKKIFSDDPVIKSHVVTELSKRHWETSKFFARNKPISGKMVRDFERSLYNSEIPSLDLLDCSPRPPILRQKYHSHSDHCKVC